MQSDECLLMLLGEVNSSLSVHVVLKTDGRFGSDNCRSLAEAFSKVLNDFLGVLSLFCNTVLYRASRSGCLRLPHLLFSQQGYARFEDILS